MHLPFWQHPPQLEKEQAGGLVPQTPLLQLSLPQLLHALPLVPQAVFVVPGWQTPPMQQPAQFWLLQVGVGVGMLSSEQDDNHNIEVSRIAQTSTFLSTK